MVSAGGLVAIVGLIAVGALAFSLRDDIKNRLNPPSPEELQVQKIEKDRGALANTQAFIFGEESLRPSKVAPNLASLQRDTKVIQKQLGIPNSANFTVTNKGVIISEKPPRFTLSTKEQLTASEALARNKRKTQKENEAFDIMTAKSIPTTNKNNVVGKPTRISKGEKKPIKRRQRGFRGRGLIPVASGTNPNNVVPIRFRRTSAERKQQGIVEDKVEIKEVNLQIG